MAASLILSQPVWGSENNFSVGYGFALWSEKHSVGNVAEGPYNFVQAAYSHEMPLSQKWLVEAGPFLSYVMNPTEGVDAGVNLGLKIYPFTPDRSGFFFTMGTGAAYSTIKYSEQSKHEFFILQGGIGYRYKSFFIEDRYRHYSNGGLSTPNRSINANIISLGMYFYMGLPAPFGV